jgi:hypothetical protein
MDSRILHIAHERALRSVVWDQHAGNEYVLIGDGTTFDVAKLQSLVDARFSSPVLWLSRSRHEAASFERGRAGEEIVRVLSERAAVTISEGNVRYFLQALRMGVARTGVAQANYAFKPTAGDMLGSSGLPPASGGLTRR